MIDGDTIEVGDVRVRIHGIDAPETGQTCTTQQGEQWACGAWVNAQVRAGYEGKHARCKRVDIDKYGRVVASCQIGSEDLGATLVRQGWAFAYRKYSDAYISLEKQAIIGEIGLHASQVQKPAEYRKTRVKGRIPLNENCTIKGNISSRGIKIFHIEGQRFYDRTGIDESKGERWFCSRSEAIKAGWRPAQR